MEQRLAAAEKVAGKVVNRASSQKIVKAVASAGLSIIERVDEGIVQGLEYSDELVQKMDISKKLECISEGADQENETVEPGVVTNTVASVVSSTKDMYKSTKETLMKSEMKEKLESLENTIASSSLVSSIARPTTNIGGRVLSIADRRVAAGLDMYSQGKDVLQKTKTEVHDKVTCESYKILDTWLPDQDETESSETTIDDNKDMLVAFPNILTNRLRKAAWSKVSQARLRSEDAVAAMVPVNLFEYSKAMETQSKKILDQWQGQLSPYSVKVIKVANAANEDLTKVRENVRKAVSEAANLGMETATKLCGDKLSALNIETKSLMKLLNEKCPPAIKQYAEDYVSKLDLESLQTFGKDLQAGKVNVEAMKNFVTDAVQFGVKAVSRVLNDRYQTIFVTADDVTDVTAFVNENSETTEETVKNTKNTETETSEETEVENADDTESTGGDKYYDTTDTTDTTEIDDIDDTPTLLE